ncbi:MAG: discoidin domain-containing protein [Planctomycetota bacterium]|nr:discoidin domain-containing protein [Planctomycetota bacterium]
MRITATTAMLILGLCVPTEAGGIVPPETAPAQSTFCNPLNIEYCFRPDGASGREAADPMVVPFQGDYYLFASKSAGYWWSPDLLHWTLVPSHDHYAYFNDEHQVNGQPEKDLPVWGYGPAAAVVGGALLYSQQLDAFYRLIDPKKGSFERVRDRLPVSNDDWLFADDDGKVYLYAVGFTPVRGIYAYELDPKDGLKILRGPSPCMPAGDVQANPEGFFRVGPAEPGPLMPIANKTGEGAQMTKRNGVYHLQISTAHLPDLFVVYRDIAFTSRSPWGPFRYSPANPVSYRPAGFCTGAGNSGVFADKHGQDWRIVTANVGVYHDWERRVALYPAGVDRDNQLYTDTYLGDLPQHGMGYRRPGPGGNLVGWMLLSYGKRATASSALPNHPTEQAFDENIRSWWSAKTGAKGEWLAVDLGKPCRINAVQVNFAEQDATARTRRVEDELYHQYTLETSDDGRAWTMRVDKSANQRDVPHDYVHLEKPVLARHVRLTNIHMPGHGRFAVRDLRVFGSGLGQAPAEVTRVSVHRAPGPGAVQATLEWPAAAGATAYVVRWGHAKDRLHHSQDVRDTKATISSLTVGLDYYFLVDSLNDNGVTFGTEAAGMAVGTVDRGDRDARDAAAPVSSAAE